MSESTPDFENEAGVIPAAPTRSTRRRAIIASLVLVFLLTGFFFGARALVHAFTYESTDDAFVEGHIVAVSPKITGHVVKLHVADNQAVKKGDLLLEIDARDYEQQVKQAQAALDAAAAKHKTALESVALTRATGRAAVMQASSSVGAMQAQSDATRVRAAQVTTQIAGAEANLEQARARALAAEAEVTRTEPDVRRYRELFEKGDVSGQRFEQANAANRIAVANLEAAKKQVMATEAALKQARAERSAAAATLAQSRSLIDEAQGRLEQANAAPKQVAVAQAEAESADAEIERARAALEQAKLNLSYTKIYAAESGRVTKRLVEEGAFVSVGQAMLSIVPDDVWVVANFKETQLRNIRPGQEVEVEVDALGGVSFQAKVDSIQAGTGGKFALLPPDNATGNFTKVVQRVPVKIVFEGAELEKYQGRVTPGLSTIVSVKVK
jgi:membrane fusion protein (multidrug efflux system)